MNNTITVYSKVDKNAPVTWAWHRLGKRYKSHLIRWSGSVWGSPTACGLYGFATNPQQVNHNMTDPCKRCLRASAGKNVGKG